MKMVLYIILVLIFIIICILHYLLTRNYDYWKKRNVPHLKPLPFFGNHKDTILLKKHITQVVQEICQQFPKEPYIGTFYSTKPALIIQDLDLIKLVLTKDFYYFSGREVTDYSHMEPATDNLFFSGGDKWNVLRQNLTSIFSPAKMKANFYLIKNCANQLERLLEEETKKMPHTDAKNLFARFVIDCITVCGYGLNSNAMNADSTSPFLVISKIMFETSVSRGLKQHFRAIWPGLFYGLKFSTFNPILYNFFNTITTIHQSVERPKTDFIDLILTWKQKKYLTGDSLSSTKIDEKKVSVEVNECLLVGQHILIFGGGYETITNSLSYILYELAKHQDVQEKVIEEVDSYFENSNGAIEYECINNMPYLESCIEEVYRLHPVLGVMTREVMDNYTFPTGLRLQKGDIIHIPVDYIQNKPDNFPEPEQFRPERFLKEARNKIKQFTYMPFGEGRRMCIGRRFAKMTVYAALLTIFKNYRVKLSKDMPHSVKIETTTFISTPASPINIKFVDRK